MNRRWTDATISSLPVARTHRPLILPTPHASYAPLPVDWRTLRRSARLALGAAICAVFGHCWACHVVIRSDWSQTAGDYTKTTYRERRRHCPRCDRHQTRDLHGSWTNR